MYPPLTVTSLLELTRLFEYSSVFLNEQGQRLLGVPRWALAHACLTPQERAHWLVSIGYASVYPVNLNGERVLADVRFDADANHYVCRSETSFRKMPVCEDDLAILAVPEDRLMHSLADVCEVPIALRSGIQSPAIADVLWRLGKIRIQAVWIDLWCARHLSINTAQIFRYLKNKQLPDKGLVLTCGAGLPEVIPPPRQYHFLALGQVICPRGNGCGIDGDLLHRVVGGAALPATDQSGPVRFDSYSNTLVITTKSIAPWSIKGARQQAVVRYLVDQLHKDRAWVPSHEILAYVYGAQQQGHSRRISDIFRGNLLWKDYITTSAKGLYGFKLD
ncbi:MAG TPA: hypothetical protein PKE57_00375 [Cellvibrionaceae bacterium]|nr:hypothetical protein [Cellvibrionaceae bacterium]HMW47948.1 hypothetical protein [Cellvibrionaceae bacterium]HMW71224.1 hypothetical protein [Cellvibrionaceae bacterium]HMY37919.1 hypothetical protein [Marinagarivorans sp.]HNG60131.1 hypothetical protein [Cellvibrionaceae bacterium]